MGIDLDVLVRLENLHCHRAGDWDSSADPYIWVAFFKIDGETCAVTRQGVVGESIVVVNPGHRTDLARFVVGDGGPPPRGKACKVPARDGEFRTTLQQIPVHIPGIPPQDGVVGAVLILFEADNTPDRAARAGHDVLRGALKKQLDALIPTLAIVRPDADDIERITRAVGDEVTAAIADGQNWAEKLFLNQDDLVGAFVFTFTHSDLGVRRVSGTGDPHAVRPPESFAIPNVMPLGGQPISKRVVDDDGNWTLTGHVFARLGDSSKDPVELDVIAHFQEVGDVLGHATELIGSRGDSRSIEGYSVRIDPPVPGLSLECMGHVQDQGDTPWLPEGSFVGTRGEERRLEGFAVRLKGPAATGYRVRYWAHVQDAGDLPETGDGAFIGTRGKSLRLEAMSVRDERV